MSGGGTKVSSGLTQDQKHMLSMLSGMIQEKDLNGLKHGMGYGLLDNGPTAYKGPLTSDLLPQYSELARVATKQSPWAGYQEGMNAIKPFLGGQQSMNFQSLLPPSTFNPKAVTAPNANYQFGAMQGPPTRNSTYDYNPSQVKTTLDNSKFTQDYFNQGVKAPLLRAYDQEIAPRIADTAAASGGGTFSTRTNIARQKALGDLNTQMSAQLSSAVRQDEIERSQQNLASQQFNVQSGMANAQFGAGQDLQYAGLNNEAILQMNQLNSGRELAGANLNSQNALNFGSLNSQNAFNAASLNNSAKQNYDFFNTQTKVGLAENAANRRLSSASLVQDISSQPYKNAAQGMQLLAPLQNWREQNVAANYNEFMRTLPENSPWIKLALGIAGQDPNAIATPQKGWTDYANLGLGAVQAGTGLYNAFNPPPANNGIYPGGNMAAMASGGGNNPVVSGGGNNAATYAGLGIGAASAAGSLYSSGALTALAALFA